MWRAPSWQPQVTWAKCHLPVVARSIGGRKHRRLRTSQPRTGPVERLHQRQYPAADMHIVASLAQGFLTRAVSGLPPCLGSNDCLVACDIRAPAVLQHL